MQTCFNDVPTQKPTSREATPKKLGFFPTSTQSGLLREIRDLIYKEIVAREQCDERYSRFLEPCHWMYYSNNLKALNLIRNGPVWESDAISAREVHCATNPFTILAHWNTFVMPFGPNTSVDWLLNILKGNDLVSFMDAENRSASSSTRKWAAPLSQSILKHGTDYLWAVACSSLCCPRGEPLRDLFDREDRLFMQTAILQLRRIPEINVRILVYSSEESLVAREPDAMLIEGPLQRLLTAVAEGLTLTRLPRRAEATIRYNFTLVSTSDQIEFWKNRLSSMRHQVAWDLANDDEEEIWSSD